MSNTHEGVSCDNCMKSNFSGKRYKCLICYDFDLCSICYDQSQIQQGSTNASSSSSSCSIEKEGARSENGKSLRKNSKKLQGKLRPTETQIINPVALNNNIQINQSSHLPTHGMQCILTRSDHELFYGSSGGVGSSNNDQQSFTCPYCAKCGFSETTLCKHLSTQHTTTQPPNPTIISNSTNNNANQNQLNTTKKEVVCPICAVLPSSNGGDPNHLTDNLLQHINLEHIINSNKDNKNKNLDDTLNDIGINSLNGSSIVHNSSSNAAAAAAAALRFSRRLNYSQNTSRSSLTSQSGITIGNSSNRANGGGINRYAFQFGQSSGGIGSGSGGANALSSFMRSTSGGGGAGLDSLSSSLSNQMDPIAELLSQLTGVRRAASSANSTNNQLQQLQAQLNRERESLQQQSAAAAVIAAAAGSNGLSSNANISSRHHNLHHHLFSGGGLGANLTKSQLLNSLASSKSNNQNTLNPNNQNAANAALKTANNLTNAFTNQVLELPPSSIFTQTTNPRDPRYLLSKYDFNNGDNQPSPPTNNRNQINQSIFINDILSSILLEQLHTELNLTDETTKENNQQNAEKNTSNGSNNQNNYLKQVSQTDEEGELVEDLLKCANTELCMKNKANPVTTDDVNFLEL